MSTTEPPETKLLFMDEKYADLGASKSAQVTSLTGLLIPSASHGDFRNRYYRLISSIIEAAPNTISAIPAVHAAELFPEADDEVRIEFLRDLVKIVVDLDFRIFRIGYYRTPELLKMCKDERGIVGLCFLSLLSCLQNELADSVIWPVMERDQSPTQDQMFAGLLQTLDYGTYHLGSANMSVNNTNLGEVLYTTKRSAHGSVVDCLAYLLHLHFLKGIGHRQTLYKERLAELACPLTSITAHNEVLRMNIS
jgi:hypothetical protein